MEYDSGTLISYLFQQRENIPEKEKFYFRLEEGGEHVVGHHFIIKDATTTLTGNELRVPTDIEKCHIESFLKFLYLKQLDVDRMSFYDIRMVIRLCKLLNLKEPVCRKLWECIKAAIDNEEKRLKDGLFSPEAHGNPSHSTYVNGRVCPRNDNLQGNEEEREVDNYTSCFSNAHQRLPETLTSSTSSRDPSHGNRSENTQEMTLNSNGDEEREPDHNATTSFSSIANANDTTEVLETDTRNENCSPNPSARTDQIPSTSTSGIATALNNTMEGGRRLRRQRKRRKPWRLPEEGQAQRRSKKDKATPRKIAKTSDVILHEKIANATAWQKITIGPGIYSIHETLQITEANVTIEGSGPLTVLKDARQNAKDEDGTLIHLCHNGIKIRNLTIKFEKVVWTAKKDVPNRWGIHIEGNDCEVENVQFENCGIVVLQYHNTLRHLKFFAESVIWQAIRISGNKIPGGYNIVDDICIQNYGYGIVLTGSAQCGNVVSNIRSKEVDFGVLIFSSNNNSLTNLKYECPVIPPEQDDDEICSALRICDGAQGNNIDRLECFYGFQEGMKVQSIFIGKEDDEDTPPEGNRVENWTGWGLLLPPMLCEEGNNYVSEEGERPKPSVNGDNDDLSLIPQLTFE